MWEVFPPGPELHVPASQHRNLWSHRSLYLPLPEIAREAGVPGIRRAEDNGIPNAKTFSGSPARKCSAVLGCVKIVLE